MLAASLLTLGVLSTLLTVLLLAPGLLTELLASLLGRSALLVAELLRLLTARLALRSGLILVTLERLLVLGRLLALGRRRTTLWSSPLAAGLLAALLLGVSLTSLLTLAGPDRSPLWSLLSTTWLARLGGRTLLSTLLLSSSSLLIGWLPTAILVPSSTLLSALALSAAVLVVHVVARAKVRRRANKRRPPFTWTGTESPVSP